MDNNILVLIVMIPLLFICIYHLWKLYVRYRNNQTILKPNAPNYSTPYHVGYLTCEEYTYCVPTRTNEYIRLMHVDDMTKKDEAGNLYYLYSGPNITLLKQR